MIDHPLAILLADTFEVVSPCSVIPFSGSNCNGVVCIQGTFQLTNGAFSTLAGVAVLVSAPVSQFMLSSLKITRSNYPYVLQVHSFLSSFLC